MKEWEEWEEMDRAALLQEQQDQVQGERATKRQRVDNDQQQQALLSSTTITNGIRIAPKQSPFSSFTASKPSLSLTNGLSNGRKRSPASPPSPPSPPHSHNSATASNSNSHSTPNAQPQPIPLAQPHPQPSPPPLYLPPVTELESTEIGFIAGLTGGVDGVAKGKGKGRAREEEEESDGAPAEGGDARGGRSWAEEEVLGEGGCTQMVLPPSSLPPPTSSPLPSRADSHHAQADVHSNLEPVSQHPPSLPHGLQTSTPSTLSRPPPPQPTPNSRSTTHTSTSTELAYAHPDPAPKLGQSGPAAGNGNGEGEGESLGLTEGISAFLSGELEGEGEREGEEGR
ncbi:hypothetical protein BCR35DRAFT_306363 [Leucosporidium creatinivorum]|uniref:Uncharacterized protein n=1 Tax=Leucosporidium creatinivorum TaxID=106004 RepID=A0A1Y2EVU0_9BASI|nr:hypothetical protein BCR35DRAFT_306363 [Leucosporidium creatinivorum]